MTTIASSSPSFFQRVATVCSNTDNLVEGAFWSTWCGFSVYQWNSALSERQTAVSAKYPTETDKTNSIWDANKKFVLASFSFGSGISMVVSWMNQVQLLRLGQLAGYVGAMGFGGSAVVSSATVLESLGALNEERKAYFEAVDPKKKSDLALDATQTLIKIAFFVSMAAWGVLGAGFSLYGGAALFVLQDTAFYYAVVTFFAMLASLIAAPILKKCS